jgi:hypothetical protein
MTAILLSVGAALASPLEGARAAFQRGDYATALRIYQSLAAQGNADAQAVLGFMYANGRLSLRFPPGWPSG